MKRQWNLITLIMLCVMLIMTAGAFAATIAEILPADVRATTSYGKDFLIREYKGLGKFVLSSELQGSSIYETVILQESNEPAIGLSYTTAGDSEISLSSGTGVDTALSVQYVPTTTGQLKYVWFNLGKTGSPAGTLTVYVQGDTGGLPDGTAIGTSAAVNVETDVTATADWVQFTFATPVDLTASDTYHFVLKASYSASTTAYVSANSDTLTSGGNAEVCNAGAWANVATSSFMAMSQQYSFSAITGGTFTVQTNTAAAFQTLTVDMDALKPYIRAKNLVSGGSATGASCVILYGKKQYEP